MGELKGVTTDHLYYWDSEQGWIHVSETEKLSKAYENFLFNGARLGMTIKLQAEADYFHELWKNNGLAEKMIEK